MTLVQCPCRHFVIRICLRYCTTVKSTTPHTWLSITLFFKKNCCVFKKCFKTCEKNKQMTWLILAQSTCYLPWTKELAYFNDRMHTQQYRTIPLLYLSLKRSHFKYLIEIKINLYMIVSVATSGLNLYAGLWIARSIMLLEFICTCEPIFTLCLCYGCFGKMFKWIYSFKVFFNFWWNL